MTYEQQKKKQIKRPSNKHGFGFLSKLLLHHIPYIPLQFIKFIRKGIFYDSMFLSKLGLIYTP